MNHPQGSEFEGSQESMVSPFSQIETAIPGSGKKRNLGLWILLGGVVAVVLAVGGVLLMNHLRDPLRTLEPLPIAKYYEGYRSVAGSRFRGDLRVEADLGWKDGVGRLMVFSSQADPRPIVVMIPAHLAANHFTKSQTYRAELEVKEGGIIYAISCEKN